MDLSSDRYDAPDASPLQAARTILAYSALLAGLAATASIAPLVVWTLASVGFR